MLPPLAVKARALAIAACAEVSIDCLLYTSLSNLGRNLASEVVDLTDGAALSGHIGGTSSSALDMVLVDGTRRSINFSDISSITSPRAYPFKIPASSVTIEPSDGSYTAEVNEITFTPAMLSLIHICTVI